jgi:PAS domain S-box-containing protein
MELCLKSDNKYNCLLHGNFTGSVLPDEHKENTITSPNRQFSTRIYGMGNPFFINAFHQGDHSAYSVRAHLGNGYSRIVWFCYASAGGILDESLWGQKTICYQLYLFTCARLLGQSSRLVWRSFGSFVAFTVYLPNFLVSSFQLSKVDAGMRTAGFIVLATAMRPISGYLGDKFNPFKILMLVFAGLTISGVLLSFAPSMTWYTVGCLTIAFCAGTGNGTIFKLVPMYFTKQAGIANGIISAMGGLGGFFPPLLLASLFNLTGHYAIGFMALSEVALASLILIVWMFYQEKLGYASKIIENTVEGIMVTDTKGIIRSVNAAFTQLTGYEAKEVIGGTPSILKSGKQDRSFYDAMWAQIRSQGFWQGEIWNRKKNGDVYLEWLTISAVKNDAEEIVSYSGMFSDITKKSSAHE